MWIQRKKTIYEPTKIRRNIINFFNTLEKAGKKYYVIVLLYIEFMNVMISTKLPMFHQIWNKNLNLKIELDEKFQNMKPDFEQN